MTSEEFRCALKACGLRQNALAVQLGVAIATVNRWAIGKIPVPQYAVAYLELFASNAELRARLERTIRDVVRISTQTLGPQNV